MTDQEMIEKVCFIAKKLGWEEFPHPHAWGCNVPVWRLSDSDDVPLLPSDEFIEAAAYIRAGMAKIGWEFEIEGNGAAGYPTDEFVLNVNFSLDGRWEYDCARRAFDANPLSEARAVILAAEEALKQ